MTHPCWGSRRARGIGQPASHSSDFFPSSSFSPSPSPPACLPSLLPLPGLHILPSPSSSPASPTHTHTHTHVYARTHRLSIKSLVSFVKHSPQLLTAALTWFLFLRHSVQKVPDRSCSQPCTLQTWRSYFLMASVPNLISSPGSETSKCSWITCIIQIHPQP